MLPNIEWYSLSSNDSYSGVMPFGGIRLVFLIGMLRYKGRHFV